MERKTKRREEGEEGKEKIRVHGVPSHGILNCQILISVAYPRFTISYRDLIAWQRLYPDRGHCTRAPLPCGLFWPHFQAVSWNLGRGTAKELRSCTSALEMMEGWRRQPYAVQRSAFFLHHTNAEWCILILYAFPSSFAHLFSRDPMINFAVFGVLHLQ